MWGWILDLYPGAPGEMVVWIKGERGEAIRLVDHWSPSFYIAADERADLSIPLKIVGDELAWTRVVLKRERITDQSESEVLECKVKDAKKAQQLASRIEQLGPFGTYRLYNVDLPPNQSYLYERDLFPLAYCEVNRSGGRLEWRLDDNVMDYDYPLPQLKTLSVDVAISKLGRIPKDTDRIKEIRLKNENEELVIEGASEADNILELVRTVKALDPDFITTSDGDAFLLPYLIRRAEANGVADRLTLDRDGTVLRLPGKKGTSFFSYGKICYKPSAIKLYGRIHIDTSTSFSYSEAGFHGLFELSRICRMPLQTASRASIGKALSSLQFYEAFKANLLIPWKPTLAERFKDRADLLIADRGGFIFEPEMGLHEGTAELDFVSLYPSIMMRKNISAETVGCPCCPDSTNRVPELGWNVCREKGLVPKSMEIIVEKRLGYKERKNAARGADRDRYDQCQAALKWIGVATFGYLGFNNAKFGRIDAHIAVCAWDRKILVDAARVAERRGYKVVHGIVDSLWLKREGADEGDYLELATEIEKETGFTISFEGIYKWVAFLPSKVIQSLPVQNRYFGVYRTGELKVRGIEARRHDTPLLFKRCQMEILRMLAETDSVEEAKKKLPECALVFARYARRIEMREAAPEELAFAMNLSKTPGEYVNRTLQSSVARQLAGEGVDLHAGEGIRYVIRDYSSDFRRAVPVDFEEASEYDPKRYVRLLAETCESVLKVFDSRYDATSLVMRYEHGSALD
jgi:DNA polymerase-2